MDSSYGGFHSSKNKSYLTKGQITMAATHMFELVGNPNDGSIRKRFKSLVATARFLSKRADLRGPVKQIAIITGANSSNPTDLAFWYANHILGPTSATLNGGNTAYLFHGTSYYDVQVQRSAVTYHKSKARIVSYSTEPVDGEVQALHAIAQFATDEQVRTHPNLTVAGGLAPLTSPVPGVGGQGGLGYPGTVGNPSPFQLSGNNYYSL